MQDFKTPPPPVVPSFEPGSKDITIDQLKASSPLKIRKNITQAMVDMINCSPDDHDFRDSFKENILNWATVMQEGKYKIADYICAVKYVSHKLLGDGNAVAYSKVFPNRYQRLINKGLDSKGISAYATMYNKGELVNKIMERTLVPIYVLNSDLLQEAINAQAELMRSARSETVRHKAAANLIENLKQPEAVQVKLDVGYNNDTVEDLRAVTRALAVQQRKMIAGGHMTANDVAGSEVIPSIKEQNIVEAEFAEIESTPKETKKNRLLADFYDKK